MSLNATILELSKQITYLQTQYDELMDENQQIKAEIQKTKIKRKNENRKSESLNLHFQKSVEALRQKRLKEFEQEFQDDLSIIRKRYPRWKPTL